MKLVTLKSHALRWSSLVLLLVLIGVYGWLTQKYHWVFDWTRDNRNSLTEISRTVLEQIDQPLKITVLARNSASERHILRRKIAKYQRYKPDISLQFLDAETAREQARKQHLNNPGQLRLDYQNRFEIVDHITEHDLTNALQRLSRETKPWVAFLAGHGERDPFSEENQGFSILKQMLDSGGMQIQAINLLETTSIPDNTSVLVIAAPQSELLQGEEKLILEYVEHGGNLLWLREPNSSEQLHRLSDALNVTWVDGTIIDANQKLRSILGIKHPAVVPVLEYQAHAITQNLKNQTLYPFAVGFEVDTNPEWRAQPLFYSLPRAWSETASLTGEDIVFNSEEGDTAGPLLMAAALTHARRDETEQRIVVIGDSDFMANDYIGNGENLTLSVSILQWLTDDDDDRIALLPYRAPDASIALSNTAIASLASSYLLIIPLGVLIIGLLQGRRRRKS